jgi:diguanylate cyclase
LRLLRGDARAAARLSPRGCAVPTRGGMLRTMGESRSDQPARLARLPWRVYRFRALGMGLGSLPVFAVMRELGTPWPGWAWTVVACFAWPHLAFLLATRSRDPFAAERRNLMIDSAIAGAMVALMHVNALPSAVLVNVAIADKVSSGVRGLWLRSLPGMIGAFAVAGLFTGYAVDFASSMTVVLACLPIFTIHTLAVAASSYQLVRRVQRQNAQLDELLREDALTGLASRAHWLDRAGALLAEHQQRGIPATLVMLDLDHFKAINDRHGHAVGDDVLRAVASCIRDAVGESGHAGRLGGDEFALALRMGPGKATALAETLRACVEALALPATPALRCSVSLGIAPPPDADLGLREWMEAADRALYESKHGGRNRTSARAPR